MKYKIPQLMCFLLAIILIVSPINTKAMEVTESGQQGVSVKASIEPSFTVSLPANIELRKSGNTATCTQQIGVKGDIQVSGSVSVAASPNFTMFDVSLRPDGDTTTPSAEADQNGYPHKTPVAATTTQSAVIWPYAELSQLSAGAGFTYDGDTGFHNTDMSIKVTGFTAGKWEGLVNFDISYDNGLTLAPGLYSAEGVMTASWDDLVADGTIHVNDGTVATNYVDSSGDSNSSSDTLVGKLVIPNSVTSIGDSAFSYCTSLTAVIIPGSVTSIGGYAFKNCSNLTSVTIPDGVTSIGERAFQNCSNLTSVTIPDGVTSISSLAFSGCTGLTSVTIPDSVTSIGESAFGGCSSLTSVIIPNSVTSIGKHAFGGCSNLTSVAIPDSVTSICDSAFYWCINLTSVTIPDGVTSIGNSAFRKVPHIYYNGDATGAPWGALAIN